MSLLENKQPCNCHCSPIDVVQWIGNYGMDVVIFDPMYKSHNSTVKVPNIHNFYQLFDTQPNYRHIIWFVGYQKDFYKT